MPRLFLLLTLLALPISELSAETLRALIVDGQNNHKNWPETTQMMKKYLEDTGRFTVDVLTTTRAKGTDPNFKPEFKSTTSSSRNYNGDAWPKETQATLSNSYMKGGGGFACIHAADNAFPEWPEYNEMIGLGGWGGRNEKSGPYVYLDDAGKVVRDDSKGGGGHHGPQHPFHDHRPRRRAPDHQAACRASGCTSTTNCTTSSAAPDENMHILATTFADPAKQGTGRHEPMIITLDYGKGRVFHTPMGHGNDSQ